jgi:hypothetical protein
MLYPNPGLVEWFLEQTNECVCFGLQTVSRHPALPVPGRSTPITMTLLKVCLLGLTLVLMLNSVEAHRRQNPGRRGAGAMQMQMRCFDEHGHGTPCFAIKVSCCTFAC